MTVAAPGELAASPLWHRLRVALGAPASEVWALVGDFARFPEYSSGLARVETTRDSSGACTGYTCHFRPLEPGLEGISHREIISWYALKQGWASTAEEPNIFGLSDALTLVALEPSSEGTIVTWATYYQADDLALAQSEFEPALVDIGENLLRLFRGGAVEPHVENFR